MKRIVLAIITIIYSLFLSPLFAQQVNNTIDEVIWVVGDEAILKSDVEGMRRDPMWSQIQRNPYCVIAEHLAIQ